MLAPRTGILLRYIVEQYIARAVPVPSDSIVKNYGLPISSATVRNEMAYLEKEGYIIRPHTSAGAIPSDRGYRYYVESLTDIRLPLDEQRLISHLFHQLEKEIENWLSLASSLLARSVQNVAVVATPKPLDSRFQHLELVVLQDSLALLVLVLRGAKVKQQLITLEGVISQLQLTSASNRLNTAYSGLNRSEVFSKRMALSPIELQVTGAVLEMMQPEDEWEYEEPHLDGWQFMFNQPEFTQSQRMLALMELVGRRRLINTIIPHHILPGGKVQVVIGRENEAEIIRDYSVVFTRYGLPDEAMGTISVIGPTRMPYARTIAMVGYLSSVLSRLVAELYGKQTKFNTN